MLNWPLKKSTLTAHPMLIGRLFCHGTEGHDTHTRVFPGAPLMLRLDAIWTCANKLNEWGVAQPGGGTGWGQDGREG